MKKIMMFILIIALVMITFTNITFADISPLIVITADKTKVNQNGQIKVNISGENLKDLYAYDIRIVYDTDKLEFKNAKASLKGLLVTPKKEGNQVTLAFTQMGKAHGQNGNVKLNTLTFKAISKGTACISVGSAELLNSKLETTNTKGKVLKITVNSKGKK